MGSPTCRPLTKPRWPGCRPAADIHHRPEFAPRDYQLTAVRGHDGDVLITGLPLAGMDLTLYRVELAELIAFSAVLLLAGFSGTGFVRLSLCPLRRVAATVTRVTELPLASGSVTLAEQVPTPIRGPRWARSAPRSTGCCSTSRRPWPGVLRARRGCAGSPRTRVTSCAPRCQQSGATRRLPAATRAPFPPTSSALWTGWSRSPPGRACSSTSFC